MVRKIHFEKKKMLLKIHFGKKKNVTFQPSATKEPRYFHLVKQHISFLKQSCVILSPCTDLCAGHSKVQVTFWFITVMMMMMIWEWRCLASSAGNSWSYLFSGDVEMQLRKETNVCWARSAPLTNGHKLQGGYWCSHCRAEEIKNVDSGRWTWPRLLS